MNQWLHKKIKLSHHRHSGRALPHAHTSHGALIAVVLAAGLMLFFVTRSMAATAQSLTSSGNINVSGLVPGPPPSEPAWILQPKDGQVFTSSPIDVAGTCPEGVFVEIYKNGILAGTAPCVSGSFSLQIDLIIGKNELIAKVVDHMDQYGPDSAPVTVQFRPTLPPVGPSLPPSTPGGPGGSPRAPGAPKQLIITTEAQYFGVRAWEVFELALIITGGVQPYAISIEWSDGTRDIVSRAGSGKFLIRHTYQVGHIYNIKIEASDSAGNKAYSQTAVLISGKKVPAPGENKPYDYPLMEVLWPVYVGTLAAVSTFWLGEKYEQHRLMRLWKTKFRVKRTTHKK